MMRRRIILLICLLATSSFLVACSPQSQSSKSAHKASASSTGEGSKPSTKEKYGNESRHPTDLPKDADSAKTDKIYATDGSEIYYEGSNSGLTASAPEYKGYTADKVKKILGNPNLTLKTSSDIIDALRQEEPQRIISLFKNSDITREEARAFAWKAVDFALNNSGHYYIYYYKEKDIILLFNCDNDNLVYITPNPTYVYWR